jgi:hypothetical protein
MRERDMRPGRRLPPRRSFRWEQAELAGLGDRLGPAGDAELAVDGLDLAADGVDRDRELPADLPSLQPGREQPQDRELPLGEGRGRLDPAAGGCADHPLSLGDKRWKHARVGDRSSAPPRARCTIPGSGSAVSPWASAVLAASAAGRWWSGCRPGRRPAPAPPRRRRRHTAGRPGTPAGPVPRGRLVPPPPARTDAGPDRGPPGPSGGTARPRSGRRRRPAS